MLPGEFDDHPENEYLLIDQDDFNTAFYAEIEAKEFSSAMDDIYDEFEHSLDVDDLNTIETSLTFAEEGGSRRQKSVSGAAHAAASVAKSFVFMVFSAAIVTSSYVTTMADKRAVPVYEDMTDYVKSFDDRLIHEGETVSYEDEGVSCTEGGIRTYTVTYVDDDGITHVETYREEVQAYGHSYILSTDESTDGEGGMVNVYTCERCGSRLTLDASFETEEKEQYDNEQGIPESTE